MWVATGPWAMEGGGRSEGTAAECKKKYRERWGDVKLRKEKEPGSPPWLYVIVFLTCARPATMMPRNAWAAPLYQLYAAAPSPKCNQQPATRRDDGSFVWRAGLTETKVPRMGADAR